MAELKLLDRLYTCILQGINPTQESGNFQLMLIQTIFFAVDSPLCQFLVEGFLKNRVNAEIAPLFFLSPALFLEVTLPSRQFIYIICSTHNKDLLFLTDVDVNIIIT